MTQKSIEHELKDAIPKLLMLADELCTNKISRNCTFIVTEIIDNEYNFFKQRQLNKKLNDKKTALTFSEILPVIQKLYPNLYDINLQVYKARKNNTVIDIRYYPKSSLDNTFRTIVINNPPMIHCKVPIPPWLDDKGEKFDVNWEHHTLLNHWRMLLSRLKSRLTKNY